MMYTIHPIICWAIFAGGHVTITVLDMPRTFLPHLGRNLPTKRIENLIDET